LCGRGLTPIAEGRGGARIDLRFAPAAIGLRDRLLFAVTAADLGAGRGDAPNRTWALLVGADGRLASAPRNVSPPSSNGAAPSVARWGEGALLLWIDPRLGPSPMYLAHVGPGGAF